METENIDVQEPELPPLPVERDSRPPVHQSAITALTSSPPSRKRGFDKLQYDISSDTPLFSSEGLTATIENYDQPRQKKMYRGCWWTSQGDDSRTEPFKAPVVQKRSFKRNFDSGVWMGSDSSGISDAEQLIEENENSMSSTNDHRKATERISGAKILPVKDLWTLAPESHEPMLTEKQKGAAKHIQDAANNNDGIIDLAFQYLEEIPWRIMKPLETLTPQPRSFNRPFEGGIRLFLSQNNLQTLPEELFNLKDVSVLSLRANQIRELSPAIGQMAQHLVELNLNLNHLRYLPMELLQFVQDRNTSPHVVPRSHTWAQVVHNPFFLPWLYGESVEDVSARHSRDPREDGLCISRITYLDLFGRPIEGPLPSKDDRGEPKGRRDTEVHPESKVPSLYELAIRSSTAGSIREVLDCMGDGISKSMIEDLQTAAKQAISGFQACSICGRKFSIARTEWLEWHRNVGPSPIPFLYRGCSWSCIPDVDRADPAARNCGWIERQTPID